jgi:hypothetical protein
LSHDAVGPKRSKPRPVLVAPLRRHRAPSCQSLRHATRLKATPLRPRASSTDSIPIDDSTGSAVLHVNCSSSRWTARAPFCLRQLPARHGCGPPSRTSPFPSTLRIAPLRMGKILLLNLCNRLVVNEHPTEPLEFRSSGLRLWSDRFCPRPLPTPSCRAWTLVSTITPDSPQAARRSRMASRLVPLRQR